MAWNKVQFEMGLSLLKFLVQCGTEEGCRDALFEFDWPKGYRCPNYNNTYCESKTREVFQCQRCHHQDSPTDRIIFEKTKLPLKFWFTAH